MNTSAAGKIGEDSAAAFLTANGYKILKRNYRAANGEIDIIAQRSAHLAFVEVKTRSDTAFGRPADAVNYKKRQKIINTARAFIMNYDDYDEISFDVCEVYVKERRINYIEGAFESE